VEYQTFFRNKVVWLTGASSGIGKELAIALSKSGASLILSSRKMQDLEATRTSCEQTDILLLPFDLENEEDLQSATNKAWQWKSGIDILFNNGGISQRAKALDSSFETDKKVFRINFLSNILLSKIIARKMIDSGRIGQLVITSSLLGKWGFHERSAYAASKHALHGYYESMRMEYESIGLKISILMPGFIATEISKHALDANGKPTGEMDQNQANGMSAAKCAAKILEGVSQQKLEIPVGGKEILGLRIKRFFPTFFDRILRKKSAR
jgi:short-subunit dehydrogenase